MHRVGFGYSPQETIPNDHIEHALAQLKHDATYVGLRSLRDGRSVIEPWPISRTYSLEERIKCARSYRKKDEELQENTSISELEKLMLEKEYQKKFYIFRYDQLSLMHQAIYGSDGVRQRFIQFWMNHFTVGDTNGTRFYMGHLYKDIIGRGIDGHFSELTYDVIRHPAMLTYLDNVYSIGEKSKEARENNGDSEIGLNDNLARELLELHTVSPSAKYTEMDIHNAAKILAGWGQIFNHPNSSRWFREAGISDFNDAYFHRRAEPGEKVVMERTYPTGKKSLRLLIDDLSTSVFTIEFISYKLCLHFISDEPSHEDVNYVANAWRASHGYLPDVHKAVIERSANADVPKVQWPLTWLLTLARITQARLFYGWEDMYDDDDLSKGEYKPRKIMEELGQNFWARRQPDGFSLNSIDWISPEHMERRIRFSTMITKHCKPQLHPEELASRVGASSETLELISKGRSIHDQFILLACSKEIMGTI